MQRIGVDSTDIVSIGYEESSRTLEIEFRGGRIYRYAEVDPEVYRHFTRTDSYGRYFNTHINNRYRYKRVDAETQASTSSGSVAFVTGNARKARDLQLACAAYSIVVEQLDLPVDEIQSHDAADIANKKAKHAYLLAQRPVVVQDTFWNILALRGFPGAFMSYVTRWLHAEDFLRLMANKSDRTVLGTETLVYYDGKRAKTFSQDYQGVITEESRGKGLFPIDQIVVLSGQTKTIAELEDEHARSAVDPTKDKLYAPFAKWLNMQRRLGK